MGSELTSLGHIGRNIRLIRESRGMSHQTLKALRRKRLVKGARMLQLTKLGREAVRF